MIARVRKSLADKDEGFTLVELLVVMIVIGILASIAIPLFLNQKEKARETAAKTDAKNVATQVASLLVDNPLPDYMYHLPITNPMGAVETFWIVSVLNFTEQDRVKVTASNRVVIRYYYALINGVGVYCITAIPFEYKGAGYSVGNNGGKKVPKGVDPGEPDPTGSTCP